MDEYIIRSVCEDCGCEFAVVLYHVCDKMDDPRHDTCTDDCNPEEIPFVSGYHDRDDAFFRCAKCDSLNTSKQWTGW